MERWNETQNEYYMNIQYLNMWYISSNIGDFIAFYFERSFKRMLYKFAVQGEYYSSVLEDIQRAVTEMRRSVSGLVKSSFPMCLTFLNQRGASNTRDR